MELLQAFILGMVQGLGEFLPISSSAHLIITPWLFNWKDQGLAFDVALHWGTLLAVVAYFYNEIWLLTKGFFHSLRKTSRDLQNNFYQRLSWLIILATIPAVIVGKLLGSQVETVLRDPLVIAGTLSVVGVILWLADRFGSKLVNLSKISWINALLIGIGQAVAVIPGVSRSGSTMIVGLFQGLTRQDTAKFSFLLSVPIILGAGLAELPNISLIQNKSALLVGFLSAAFFGFISIKFLLKYISGHSFALFTWYRLGLALLILIIYFIR